MTSKKSTKRALLLSGLALLTCFSMLIGSTYAWFTDSVTSGNNIIKSGNLDVEMYWADGDTDPATTDTWQDASKVAIFDYDLWEPGYIQARHLKISNIGTLALKYQLRILANGVVSELADVIDVYFFDGTAPVTRDMISKATPVGTLSQALNTPSASLFTQNVKGDLIAGASKTVTIALKMQESAGNEYQGLSIGTDFSVQLLATQYTSESDSFDKTYDQNADFAPQEIPSATVFALTGDELNINHTWGIGGPVSALTLNAGYSFQPTETYEQALASKYANAHADFYIYADNDVKANSLAVAGYYEAWCSLNNYNWVALTASDISANTPIRLIADGMNEGKTDEGITVPYNAICQYGNDGIGFKCGIADLDGSNAGTTVTVELRIYPVKDIADSTNNSWNEETGEYITVGTFTYTFPAKEVGNQAELNDAINNGIAGVELAAGEYTMPEPDLQGKKLTVSGTKDTVIDMTEVDARNQFVTGAELVFDGVTLNFGEANYMGLANTASLTYKNCTINGLQFLYGDNVSFENCDLNSNDAEHCVWTYGAKNVTFTDCDFTYGDRAVNVYIDNGTGAVSVSFDGCTFATENTASKGAVEINSSAFPQGAEVDFVDCTAPANGTMVGISGWDSANGANAKVTVNGAEITATQWAK